MVGWKLVCCGLTFGAFAFGGFARNSQPQSYEIDQEKPITLQYEDADLRRVLDDLFRTIGVRYSLDPSVSGRVTLIMHNRLFEDVIQWICRQDSLTYHIKNGVYHFSWATSYNDHQGSILVDYDSPSVGCFYSVFLSHMGIGAIVPKTLDQPLQLRTSGNLDQILLNAARQTNTTFRGGSAYRFEGRDSIPVPSLDVPVSVEFGNANLRNALQDVLQSCEAPFRIDPDVAGTVTMHLFQVPLETALYEFKKQCRITYRIEKGSIRISQPHPKSSSMTQDREFLYVTKDDHILKIRKSDLKVIASTNLP
ncbi:MAG TPA: hypothetical protein VG944_21570 [Fimbriimonas sp.]|nr:hypothetical protein [Fimbriimonas sp.]